MTTKPIRVDYVQVASRILDALNEMISLGLPDEAADVSTSSIDLARQYLDRIAFSGSHREFCQTAHHIKAQLLPIEATANAVARPCVAVAVTHYIKAVLTLLDDAQHDFDYADDVRSYTHF